MNRLDNMIYICTLPTYCQANAVLSHAYKFLERYGHVTMADMKNLCGMSCSYEETTIGWDGKRTLDNRVIQECREGYSLYVPKFNWYKIADKRIPTEKECDKCERDCVDCDCKCCEETEEPQSEPFNITISFDRYLKHPEVINDVFQALLKDPEKIKDRPVFISIM